MSDVENERLIAIRSVKQDKTGKFRSIYQEKRGEPISLRLPVSLDAAMRAAAEQEGITVKQWVENAIAFKLKNQA